MPRLLALLGLALGLHGCAQSPAVAPRTYDVVVYGDSAAAVAAALQAKRQGSSVVLVNTTNHDGARPYPVYA